MGLATPSPIGLTRKISRAAAPQARPLFWTTLEGLEDRLVPARLVAMNLPPNVTDINVVETGNGPSLQPVIDFAGQVSETETMNLKSEAAPGGPSVAQGEC